MDFLELAEKRYSVKNFTDKPVEEDKIRKILKAGMLAPTAKNNQPQKIYILKSQKALEMINTLSPCIYGAKTVFLIGYDRNLEWNNPEENGIHSGVEDASKYQNKKNVWTSGFVCTGIVDAGWLSE